MPLHVLDDKIWFPPVEDSLEDGLLAIGGDLTTERLLAAYKKGIFPWYQDEVPLWWSPHPRFVLFPEELKVSKSMKSILNKALLVLPLTKLLLPLSTRVKKRSVRGRMEPG
jgi:leucyl/phenylalanyl-tRNA--protein transferase